MTTSAMTSTAAIQHMSHTLTGLIAQSHQPGFVAAEAYADVKFNFEHVAAHCQDFATVVWLKNHLCFGYVGDECTFEDVNLPYLKQFNHILATGWRPGAAPAHQMKLSNMFELDWWEAKDVTVTKREGENVYGTATATDTEGEYQIAFEWLMETGKNAADVGLPAIVSVTAGRFTLPYDFSLFECDGTPMDTLEAIQEMDCVLGLSADIFNDVYNELFPNEAESHG